jgi:hypothetical protein
MLLNACVEGLDVRTVGVSFISVRVDLGEWLMSHLGVRLGRGYSVVGTTLEQLSAMLALDERDAAIAHAVEQGWLIAAGSPAHSICLTDAGRVWAARLAA